MSDDGELLGWVTISELARMRGVDKAAISRRVARFESLGLVHPRAGVGRTKLVNIAEFDRAAGETTDAVREANGRGAARAPDATGGDPILAREQARRAAVDADLKELDLAERVGELVAVEPYQRKRIVGIVDGGGHQGVGALA